MKTTFLILICVGVLAVGCKKNKQAVENASSSDDMSSSDDSDRLSRAPEAKNTQVAQGEMKELLLALRRVHFPFDSTTLGNNAKSALDDAAEKLRSITNVDLYVDGHTDERGTTEYNMSLSERRAHSVVGYLKNSGVDPNRLSVVSFGEDKPMAEGGGRQQHAMNRRVEFRLMRGDVQFVLEDGDLVDDDGSALGASENDADGEDQYQEPENDYLPDDEE